MNDNLPDGCTQKMVDDSQSLGCPKCAEEEMVEYFDPTDDWGKLCYTHEREALHEEHQRRVDESRDDYLGPI